MSSSAFMDAVVLFGDSITQAATAGSLSQRMGEYFSRRMDVINRGYGGYNTEWAIPVFKKAFATTEALDKGQAQRVKLVTIWFGANDSVLEGGPQHVPLDRYKDNLIELVRSLRDASSPYHSPDTHIVLINPPPIIPSKWAKHLSSRKAEQGDHSHVEPDRVPEQTKRYAEACLQVAHQEHVDVIDVHSAIIEAAGGDDDTSLDPYLYDGLHLTPLGYHCVVKELIQLIETQMPELSAGSLEMRVPDWSDVDPSNPYGVLGGL